MTEIIEILSNDQISLLFVGIMLSVALGVILAKVVTWVWLAVVRSVLLLINSAFGMAGFGLPGAARAASYSHSEKKAVVFKDISTAP